ISGASDSVSSGAGGDGSAGEEGEEAGEDLRRPRLFWFNVALTIAVIACLVAAVAPPELLFLVAVLIALLVNYPGLKQQTARIEAHSKGAMLMATTLLAAGVFLGILEGSGMIDAMASTALGLLPDGPAPALPLILAVLGVPLSRVYRRGEYDLGVIRVLIGVGVNSAVSGGIIAAASRVGEEPVEFPVTALTVRSTCW